MPNIPGYDDDGFPMGPIPAVTLPAATAHDDTPRGRALTYWLDRGHSVVGYHVALELTWEESYVETATVYARGPIDRSATVLGQYGRTELTSRDGDWYDSVGIPLSGADSKVVEDAWQWAVGFID